MHTALQSVCFSDGIQLLCFGRSAPRTVCCHGRTWSVCFVCTPPCLYVWCPNMSHPAAGWETGKMWNRVWEHLSTKHNKIFYPIIRSWPTRNVIYVARGRLESHKTMEDFMLDLFIEWWLRNLQMTPSPKWDVERPPNRTSTRHGGTKKMIRVT